MATSCADHGERLARLEECSKAVPDHESRIRVLERFAWRMGAILAVLACLGSIFGGAISARLFGDAPAAASPAPAAVAVPAAHPDPDTVGGR